MMWGPWYVWLFALLASIATAKYPRQLTWVKILGGEPPEWMVRMNRAVAVGIAAGSLMVLTLDVVVSITNRW